MGNSRRSFLRASLVGGLGFSAAMASLTQAESGEQSLPQEELEIPGVRFYRKNFNGIEIGYAMAGNGPAILLIHGWPFTWYTWHKLIPTLAKNFTVIAPDMRGIGASGKPVAGYDVLTLANDAAALLSGEGFSKATVVGHDLGVGVAFQLAARHPNMVEKLVLTESIVLGAPNAEIFMKSPPWWVAWHNVPDLPESVLAGREGAYLDWFYKNLTHNNVGISRAARNQHVMAYTGVSALRGGFEHYRAFPKTTELGREAAQQKIRVPILALGGELVGDVLFRQMAAVGDHVTGGRMPGCGHVIQEEMPNELLDRLKAFF